VDEKIRSKKYKKRKPEYKENGNKKVFCKSGYREDIW
jgi:hypothetical protein